MKNILRLIVIFLFVSPIAEAQIKPVDSVIDGKYININGAKLWVVTVGERNPIIFIAGGPGNNHFGLRSFDPLAQSHHQHF